MPRRHAFPTALALLALASPAFGQLSGLDDSAEKAAKVAALIDKHLERSWTADGVRPAPAADDAEYLRRVSLDVIGRTPRVAEVRAFLADSSPDKRAAAVARLVQMPAHAGHFANQTRVDWLPGTLTDFRTMFQGNQFETWLRTQYARNTPADEVARKLVTAAVAVGQRGRTPANYEGPDADEKLSVAAYYQANDGKPETIASTVSRTFLGVKVECAQCHDHPFAPYTRDQFWQFAAFFGEFTPLSPTSPSFVGPLPPQADFNQISIPNTVKSVTAAFFDGTAPTWTLAKTPRDELAAWMTDRKNPYFARNAANRLWAQFFGLGLIDPVDEPGPENPPSHPELLDGLAAAYADCGFDTRVMVRGIAASRAYGLSSRQTHATQANPRRHARMSVRGLTGPQIYASFLAATGGKDRSVQNDYYTDEFRANKGLFNAMFGQAIGKPTESQTSILQSLMMMNGKPVARQTSVKDSDTLAAVCDAPFLTTEKRVETLFLAALGRPPTADERERFASSVDRAGKPDAKNEALADLFWVLLNSPEFLFNR